VIEVTVALDILLLMVLYNLGKVHIPLSNLDGRLKEKGRKKAQETGPSIERLR
jgi:hypothetical protein